MPSYGLIKRRPPRSTPLYSSAASDVYKRQENNTVTNPQIDIDKHHGDVDVAAIAKLSLIHISEPTRLRRISYAVLWFNKTATTEIYTSLFVGSVRCV